MRHRKVKCTSTSYMKSSLGVIWSMYFNNHTKYKLDWKRICNLHLPHPCDLKIKSRSWKLAWTGKGYNHAKLENTKLRFLSRQETHYLPWSHNSIYMWHLVNMNHTNFEFNWKRKLSVLTVHVMLLWPWNAVKVIESGMNVQSPVSTTIMQIWILMTIRV